MSSPPRVPSQVPPTATPPSTEPVVTAAPSSAPPPPASDPSGVLPPNLTTPLPSLASTTPPRSLHTIARRPVPPTPPLPLPTTARRPVPTSARPPVPTIPPPSAPAPAARDSGVTAVGGTRPRNAAASTEVRKTLWDAATVSLKTKESRWVKVLEKKMGERGQEDLPSESIQTMLSKRHEKMLAKDKISQSWFGRWSKRAAKFVLSTEKIGMRLSLRDPHGVAPYVMSGVYTIAQLIEGSSNDALAALSLTMDIAAIISLWECLERTHMTRKQDPAIQELYNKKLEPAIVEMYEHIITLLGTLLAFFDSKTKQVLHGLLPENQDWTKLKENMKAKETKCNNIKAEITLEKEKQDVNAKILSWISDYDLRAQIKAIEWRTGFKDKYSECCAWLVDDDRFVKWYQDSQDTVLWLNGTIGTGKTTAMLRAIHQIKTSSMVEVENHLFARFHFDRITNPDPKDRSEEKCLKALTRQLCWDYTTLGIITAAETKYMEAHQDQMSDSFATKEDCIELLHILLDNRNAFIMVDAVDECAEPNELVQVLKDLFIYRQKNQPKSGFLRIMLSARTDVPILSAFPTCYTMTTNSVDWSDDQEFYIETEIEISKHRWDGSTIVKSGLTAQLQVALHAKASGLFQWIKIQLDKFFKPIRFQEADDLKEALKELQKRVSIPTLDDEYTRLRDGLSKRNQDRALNMLKLIVCATWPLSACDLAAATTAYEAGSGNSPLEETTVLGILAGFVFENETTSRDRTHRHVHSKHVLSLAHSSVIEYLMNSDATKIHFTPSAEHTSAAVLCMAAISHKRQLDNDSAVLPGHVPADANYQLYRQSLSDFFYYSCSQWPQHSKIAFAWQGRSALAQNEARALVDQISQFIVSESYRTWNATNRKLCNLEEEFSESARSYTYAKMDRVWHDDTEKKPAFVLASYDLTKLLEIPSIKRSYNLAQLNGKNQSLFDVILRSSNTDTIAYLLRVCPETVNWDGGWYSMMLAIYKGTPEAVQRLLTSSQDPQGEIKLKGNIAERALKMAVKLVREAYRTRSQEEIDRRSLILEHILKAGPDICRIDSTGHNSLHYANAASANQLVNYARALEKRGHRRLIQKLLRARNRWRKTPIDTVPPDTQSFLEQQLAYAVARDGAIWDVEIEPSSVPLAQT